MNTPVSRVARSASLLVALTFTAAAFGQAAPETSAAPADEPPSDKVVKLEDFKVTSTIQSYHQSTSSMAAKLPMEMRDIPISLQVLNSSAITDRNAVTLVDVVGYVVGANQSQGNINGFTFRGFPNSGSYTQNIQFDGLQGPTLKKAATSAANVDSMEFLKGPNGVLYGQMNPGGLLNIVTKNPMEKQATSIRVTSGFYAGEFTNFGDKWTKTFSFDNTGPVPGFKHLFYRFVADVGNQPSSRKDNWARNWSFYPSLTYKWSKDTSFTVKMEASHDKRRQDDGMNPIFTSTPITVDIGGVATSTAAYGENATFYVAPMNTVYQDVKDTALDNGQALATFFRTTLGSEWQFRFQSRSVWHADEVTEFTVNNANVFSPSSKYAVPTSLLRRQFNHVKNFHRYNYLDANAFRSFKTGKIEHTAIVGASGGWEFFGNKRLAFGPNVTVAQAITLVDPILDQYDYPAEGTGATDQVTNQTAFGQYVSDQMKLGKLRASIGVRHDHQAVEGRDKKNPSLTRFRNILDAYTKQAGLVYEIVPQLSGYASFSQSIKPQTNIAFDSNGNSSFPPESGEQYEAGLKFENTKRTVNATFAAYEITRSNVVVPSGTNFTVATGAAQVGQAISRLDGEQKSTGVEVELRWQPLPNWQIQTGGAYSHARITASTKNPTSVGMDLANAPRKTANFWTRYNFASGPFKGFGIGAGMIRVGEAWAGDPTTAVYFKMPAWTRTDLSAYYKWKRYDFSLNVQNALDKRYVASAFSANVLNIGEQRKITIAIGTHF